MPDAKKYIVRAAIHEESNEGWVWLNDFASGTIVRILNISSKKSVYCCVRKIDDNFISIYDEKNKTKKIGEDIKNNKPLIIISDWYRAALGNFNTSDIDGKNKEELKVEGAPQVWQQRTFLDKSKFLRCYKLFQQWVRLRVATQHPNLMVRLSTRLGILGIWLGLIGAMSLISSLVKELNELYVLPIIMAGIIALIFIARIFYLLCRSSE